MDMIDIRRNVLAYDSVMEGNIFDPQEVQSVNTDYYSTVSGYNYVRVEKITSASNWYGRTKTNIANLKLVSGKKYKLTATIKALSQSNLTGFIYIADSNNSIKVQTTQLDTVHVGDKLEMTFVYNPNTMKELSFYMNRGMNVPLGTYLTYGDIFIFEQP